MSGELELPSRVRLADTAIHEQRLDGEEQPPPQWVIMGIQVRTGVAVLASSTLTRAEMARRYEEVTRKLPFAGRPAVLRKEHTAVLLQFDGFQFISGATYRECMVALAEVWSPPEPPGPLPIDSGVVTDP